MRKINQILIVSAGLILGLFGAAGNVSAAVTCQTQYGGGETCTSTNLLIDKTVLNPVTKTYVDNLGTSDYKFGPEEEIIFKVKVKNVGNANFNRVKIKDILPDKLCFTVFPTTYCGQELTYEFDNLAAGASKDIEIKAKVVPADQLSDNTVICRDNVIEGWANDNYDKDTARVCLQKKVLGAVILPKTGPSDWIILYLFTAIAGTFGLILIRKSN